MSRTKSRKYVRQPLHRPELGSILSRVGLSEHDREQRRQLIVWSVVIGGFLVWAAWPDEETGTVVYSKSGCATVPAVSLAECEAAYDLAAAEHARIAPRFDSLSQCRDQFGECQSDPSGIHWIPPLAGVLVGYRQRDDDVSGGGSVGGYRYTGSLPLYRERGGDYLNPHGDYVSSGSGKVTGDAGRTNPPARALTISRSGFGSSASARSSFGG